jgi:hypothetical protein
VHLYRYLAISRKRDRLQIGYHLRTYNNGRSAMLQLGLFGVGILFIAASILMLVLARPRNGVVVGFLRDKPNGQASYAMALMIALTLGVALIIRGSAE